MRLYGKSRVMHTITFSPDRAGSPGARPNGTGGRSEGLKAKAGPATAKMRLEGCL